MSLLVKPCDYPHPDTITVGQEIFNFVQFIAEGSFGYVYLYQNKKTFERVVIKLCKT